MKRVWFASLFICAGIASADQIGPVVWKTPVGTIGLPFQATEALLGYDAVNKEAIGGISLPVYTDPKGFMALQLGAVAPWPNNQATIQPYIAAGHDLARELPILQDYQSMHINVFGRWVTDATPNRVGVGISVSYSFAGGTPLNPVPVPTLAPPPPAPAAAPVLMVPANPPPAVPPPTYVPVAAPPAATPPTPAEPTIQDIPPGEAQP